MNTLPLIQYCSFVSCFSGDDGGGCGIWYSYSSITYVVDSCRFIKCKGIADDNSEGGGIMMYGNNEFITFTNSLFYACSAPVNAGGAYLQKCGPIVKPIKFCFFRDNKSNGARDLKFSLFDTTPQPITHSFSYESDGGKVVGGSDSWLPYSLQ